MRAAAVVLAALTVGCGVKNVKPDDPKTWGDRKDVWIFVAPEKELRDACASDVMPPTVIEAARKRSGDPVALPKKFDNVDVLVPQELVTGKPDEKRTLLPYSCVEKTFFSHEKSHRLHKHTVIKLHKRRGETVRYRALEPFRIESIEERKRPLKKLDVFSPTVLPLPTPEREEHPTGPIVRTFPWYQF
ncbi:MAG: hypothetical protein ACRD1S_07935, partial [Vicinamibacterales bacterium]